MSCPRFPENICGICPCTELIGGGFDCGKNASGGKLGYFAGIEEFPRVYGPEM